MLLDKVRSNNVRTCSGRIVIKHEQDAQQVIGCKTWLVDGVQPRWLLQWLPFTREHPFGKRLPTLVKLGASLPERQ